MPALQLASPTHTRLLVQRLELPLLRMYHAELQRCGVDDYAWETCLEDYRLFLTPDLLRNSL
jgi:hypothetical protein